MSVTWRYTFLELRLGVSRQLASIFVSCHSQELVPGHCRPNAFRLIGSSSSSDASVGLNGCHGLSVSWRWKGRIRFLKNAKVQRVWLGGSGGSSLYIVFLPNMQKKLGCCNDIILVMANSAWIWILCANHPPINNFGEKENIQLIFALCQYFFCFTGSDAIAAKDDIFWGTKGTKREKMCMLYFVRLKTRWRLSLVL